MAGQERWQVSGSAAEYYERYVSLLMEPWVQALVEVAELSPSDRVLDVGCGPGFVARRVAEKVSPSGRVVGIDLNESMLEKAREFPPSDTGVAIEWHKADVQSLPFDDESFDIVLSQQVLQFCPDPALALREIRRVLTPGGRLAFTVWCQPNDNPYPIIQMKAFEHYVGTEAASSLRAAYSMGDAEKLQELVSSVGFKNVQVRPTIRATRVGPAEEFVRGHVPALPFANDIAALSDDTREAMFAELISELGQYVSNGILEFPSASNIVTARA